jgi:hypothetical protein
LKRRRKKTKTKQTMPGTDFYRALATVKYLQRELMHERDAHNAMKLCFERIHKSLDMYQGHYINRLRFHLNRHHTEYLRKVRSMKKKKNSSSSGESGSQLEEEGSTDDPTSSTSNHQRRSMRVGIAHDLANEVEQLKNIIKRKDLEIERMAMLLDEEMGGSAKKTATNVVEDQGTERPSYNIKKLMNPYYPSDDDDETITVSALHPSAEDAAAE